MRFEITEIPSLSGRKAHVYSVVVQGDDETLLEQFFDENKEGHADDLRTMLAKIQTMADDTGCKREFFKEGEGSLADGVVALRCNEMRLYGIYFNSTVILFGSGGVKRKGARAYQEIPELNAKARQVREIARKINKAIDDGDIRIEYDGTINYENWEDYEQ